MNPESYTGTLISDLQALVSAQMAFIKAQQDFIALSLYPVLVAEPEAESDMERDRR